MASPVARVRGRRPAPGRGRQNRPRRFKHDFDLISKSLSKDGGRTSYRGLLKVYEGCENVKSKRAL